jgi:histidinol-phosphate/aromatic aminotransferase/cobyric acid decarboxylase-like protein
MKKHLPYWNINGITEMLLKLVVKDKQEYEQSRLKVIADREYLKTAISTIKGLTLFPSYANFVYIKLPDRFDGDELRDRLLVKQSCFVRNCGNKVNGSKQYFRIAARPTEEVDHLIFALKVEMDEMTRQRIRKANMIAA